MDIIVVQKNGIWKKMIRQAFKFLSVINNDYYFVRFQLYAGGVCDDKHTQIANARFKRACMWTC